MFSDMWLITSREEGLTRSTLPVAVLVSFITIRYRMDIS